VGGKRLTPVVDEMQGFIGEALLSD